eukprot:m.189671 g.189671  ORF g.189671 m.189671 type:complete len:875 (-) comp32382_c0_seq2:69-2693(-)
MYQFIKLRQLFVHRNVVFGTQRSLSNWSNYEFQHAYDDELDLVESATPTIPTPTRRQFSKLGTPQHESVVRIGGMVVEAKGFGDDRGHHIIKLVEGTPCTLGGGFIPTSNTRVTVMGTVPQVHAGEYIRVSGTWVNDAKFGKKLALKGVDVASLPASIVDESLFFRAAVKGIGPKTLKHLQRISSEDASSISQMLEQNSWKIQSIHGVGATTQHRIVSTWMNLKYERALVNMLTNHGGLDVALAVRLAARLNRLRDRMEGRPIVDVLQLDPYTLVRSRLLAFQTAEKIASNMGIALDDPRRLTAGVFQCLGTAQRDGHCGVPQTELIKQVNAVLKLTSVGEDHLQMMIDTGEIKKECVHGQICYFETGLWQIESSIASRCKTLSKGLVPWRQVADTDTIIRNAVRGKHVEFELSMSQHSALKQMLTSKFVVMTGGPGVGKTAVLQILLTCLRSSDCGIGANRVLLAAPTGRAAARLRETTKTKAFTLHRLLGITRGGQAEFDENKKLDCDLVIVDESSMIDAKLLDMLLRALPDSAAIVLVGDVDQLPAIGAGDVLRDIIDSQTIQVARLTEIHRQAQDSNIVRVANMVNQGIVPELFNVAAAQSHTTNTADSTKNTADSTKNGKTADWTKHAGAKKDFTFIKAEHAEQAAKIVEDLVVNRIPAELGLDPFKDIQVLCPTKSRGPLSVRHLNKRLQQLLNPLPSVEPQMVRTFGGIFSKNDKVMQVVNDPNKGIYNGEIGTIKKLNLKKMASEALQVEFTDSNGNARTPISYTQDELDKNLMLAYACTIHKSQGCEFKAVVIVLSCDQMIMLRRSLLYTAITRGRQAVYVVGQESAVKFAIQNNDQPHVGSPRRWTLLSTLLTRAQTQSSCVDV